MTFQELQNRVMARLNLTSTDARTRIKGYLNERLRAAQTSVGLSRCRMTTVTINTVAATATITTTGVVKPLTVAIPTLNRVLGMRSLDQLRNFDAANTWTGAPEVYAEEKYNATSVTLRLQPIPDNIYAVQIDGIAVGTDMSADGDVPGLPEDFHDLLIRGALADELDHMEKTEESMKQEAFYDRRQRELRYFISKTIYMHRAQGDMGFSNWEWWFYGSPWVTV